ncbi:MAG TPA: ribose 5-phosphate isomerase A, partial [Agitococcus sp.]|nr:ribose 5-phosphate isomerase A [Agitococcus sp.]
MTQDQLKRAVAEAALAYVEKDEILGVGTGSTAN